MSPLFAFKTLYRFPTLVDRKSLSLDVVYGNRRAKGSMTFSLLGVGGKRRFGWSQGGRRIAGWTLASLRKVNSRKAA